MSARPNFFVVGAQKCGTTSLHRYLVGHPDIYLPQIKETHFFIDDEHYAKGFEHHYLGQHFSGWAGERAVGEVDPDYMYFPYALDRIGNHLDLDELKFIFVLRNPVERAFSHYLMSVRLGHEQLPFDRALEAESDRLKNGFWWGKFFSYKDRGLYFRQVSSFGCRVDRSRMLFLLSEDLRAAPATALERVMKFLEVDTDYRPDDVGKEYFGRRLPRSKGFLKRVKGQGIEKGLIRILIPWEGPRKRLRQRLIRWNERPGNEVTMAEDTRKRLVEFFQPENERLAQFIDRDLSHWNA